MNIVRRILAKRTRVSHSRRSITRAISIAAVHTIIFLSFDESYRSDLLVVAARANARPSAMQGGGKKGNGEKFLSREFFLRRISLSLIT